MDSGSGSNYKRTVGILVINFDINRELQNGWLLPLAGL